MSKTEALREELESMLVRGVSIGHWPGELDIKACKSTIASTASRLDLFPAKANVYDNIFKRSNVRHWQSAEDVELNEFKVVEKIYLETSKPISRKNFSHHSSALVPRLHDLYFESTLNILTIEDSLDIIAMWLSHATPTYGFSCVQSYGYSSGFHLGVPSNHSDENWVRQVRAHQSVQNRQPHHDDFMGKTLLDIFELNILSPAHMTKRVFGTSLDYWITKGNRGTLRALKKNVFAWIVPDDIRADIRQAFLKSGYLVVPV